MIEALSGKWIVEAGELKGNRKAGTDHLKGFLSRTDDKARMAYDCREREVPRQCVIIGTTNDSRYLRDTTGNRRFWPVALEGFDLEALRRDRDRLWAEAAAREAGGASIRLDPDTEHPPAMGSTTPKKNINTPSPNLSPSWSCFMATPVKSLERRQSLQMKAKNA